MLELTRSNVLLMDGTSLVPYDSERVPLDDTYAYQCPSCGAFMKWVEVPDENATLLLLEEVDADEALR